MQDEIENVRRVRNAVAYQGVKNKVVKYTLSPAWSTIPPRLHIRGECIERLLRNGARVTKIVANGTISGEIKNAR